MREVSKFVEGVDAVVTEPHLGPALRGKESEREIRKVVDELSELYLSAFREFKKILNFNAKVVIVFPAFRLGRQMIELPILEEIKKMGFTQVNKDKLIYSREGQKVWRQIYIFQSR